MVRRNGVLSTVVVLYCGNVPVSFLDSVLVYACRGNCRSLTTNISATSQRSLRAQGALRCSGFPHPLWDTAASVSCAVLGFPLLLISVLSAVVIVKLPLLLAMLL